MQNDQIVTIIEQDRYYSLQRNGLGLFLGKISGDGIVVIREIGRTFLPVYRIYGLSVDENSNLYVRFQRGNEKDSIFVGKINDKEETRSLIDRINLMYDRE